MTDTAQGDEIEGLRAGFDFLCVVQWLEAGCDPQKAANELRLYIPKLTSLRERLAKAEGERDRAHEREAGLRANLDRIAGYAHWIERAVKRGAIPPPGLDALLERARNHVPSPAERTAQRRSWVKGQFMLDHPGMPETEVDALIDRALPELTSKAAHD